MVWSAKKHGVNIADMVETVQFIVERGLGTDVLGHKERRGIEPRPRLVAQQADQDEVDARQAESDLKHVASCRG